MIYTEYGQTPLDTDEVRGLLIPGIATKEDLDSLEQENILQALEWSGSARIDSERFFSEKFLRDLHIRMFGGVWKWAGQFRKTEKNIGVPALQISTALWNLQKNCMCWFLEKSFPPDEIAIRYKHRLVSIHPFPNGNGRHSRLVADIFISRILGKPIFTWGRSLVQDGASPEEVRRMYIESLQCTDHGDYSQLLKFARS
ncbi:MAG: mobile mystery protein B [Leptospira sp.]|nr:mobile mystery protein B [Leptospira sp.]